ncbi:MAG: hypothetical protein Q8R28_10710 [Dehalococcoidia bacterium]|nr:hypothetical protein [Dehalococcoidia bacterium]
MRRLAVKCPFCSGKVFSVSTCAGCGCAVCVLCEPYHAEEQCVQATTPAAMTATGV